MKKLFTTIILLSLTTNSLFAHNPGMVLGVILGIGLLWVLLCLFPLYLTCYLLIQSFLGKLYVRNRWIKNVYYWVTPLFLASLPTLYILIIWLGAGLRNPSIWSWLLMWIAVFLSLFLNIKLFIRRKLTRLRKADKETEPSSATLNTALKQAFPGFIFMILFTTLFIFGIIHQINNFSAPEPDEPAKVTPTKSEGTLLTN